jgi:ribosomal protein S18 acetylase RimI-like enzyme
MVDELTTYSVQDLADLDVLMHELSATSYCDEQILKNAINDVNSHVFIIRDDGHIVATGTLCVMHTLEFTIAGIESVVVSSRYRGLGYGNEIVSKMMTAAKEMGAHHIHLTSNPKRIEANGLYQKLGFEQYKTNCYRYYF